MKLMIEDLQEKYSLLKAALEAAADKGFDKEECLFALESMCRTVVSCTDTYRHMKPIDLTISVENDLAFIRGDMSEEQQKKHIDWHYAQLEKECSDTPQRKTVDLDSLWHDAKEMPQKGETCLVYARFTYEDKEPIEDYFTSTYTTYGWTEDWFPNDYDGEVKRWCYINDLLPQEGGEK